MKNWMPGCHQAGCFETEGLVSVRICDDSTCRRPAHYGWFCPEHRDDAETVFRSLRSDCAEYNIWLRDSMHWNPEMLKQETL
jgi:hypothetical protein